MYLSKKIVYWLLLASRGGLNRGRILLLLKKKPCNLKKIADSLHLNYKTVNHHVGIMLSHGLLESTGNGYGKIYFVSQDMEEIWDEFKEFFEKIK